MAVALGATSDHRNPVRNGFLRRRTQLCSRVNPADGVQLDPDPNPVLRRSTEKGGSATREGIKDHVTRRREPADDCIGE
jgi:hypothetical protein